MVDISLSVMCVCGCVSSGREKKHISFFLGRHWNSDGIYCSQFRMCFFLGKKESRWQIDMGLSAWCRRKEIQREGKRERERERKRAFILKLFSCIKIALCFLSLSSSLKISNSLPFMQSPLMLRKYWEVVSSLYPISWSKNSWQIFPSPLKTEIPCHYEVAEQ